jgi:hypothetical protein
LVYGPSLAGRPWKSKVEAGYYALAGPVSTKSRLKLSQRGKYQSGLEASGEAGAFPAGGRLRL